MRKSVVFLLCFAGVPAWAESYNIETRRVFGPEYPGRYKHPASHTQLVNGDLYLAYYGGSGEYGDDTAVYASRLTEAKGIPWSGRRPTAGCGSST